MEHRLRFCGFDLPPACAGATMRVLIQPFTSAVPQAITTDTTGADVPGKDTGHYGKMVDGCGVAGDGNGRDGE